MMRAMMLTAAIACIAMADAPTPAQMKNAEKTFRELFGKDYEKALKSRNPNDKIAFAKKLWETAKGTPNDPGILAVFGEKALPLAMGDPAGYPLALEIRQARVEANGKNRPGQLAAVAELLEKMLKLPMPPEKRGVLQYQLIDALRDQAEASFDLGRDAEANAAFAKAKAASKGLPQIEEAAMIAEMNAIKQGYDGIRKHLNELRAAKESLAKNPMDANAHLLLAAAYLRTGSLMEAQPHLLATGNASLKKLGEAIAAPLTDPTALGDALRGAVEAMPGMKNVLLGLARKAYYAGAEALPNHANSGRARLVARELPPFRAVNEVLPSKAFAVELLDEAETSEPTLARWTNKDAKFSGKDKRFGETALVLPPGKYSGALAAPVVIAPNPKPGEYQYLRLAVKQSGGTNFRIELNAGKHAAIAYCAGNHLTDRWVSVSKEVPKDWLVLSRNMMPDRAGTFSTAQQLTLDSILIESDGTLLIDGFWLGRSARDLDRLQPRPLE